MTAQLLRAGIHPLILSPGLFYRYKFKWTGYCILHKDKKCEAGPDGLMEQLRKHESKSWESPLCKASKMVGPKGLGFFKGVQGKPDQL